MHALNNGHERFNSTNEFALKEAPFKNAKKSFDPFLWLPISATLVSIFSWHEKQIKFSKLSSIKSVLSRWKNNQHISREKKRFTGGQS